MKLENEHVLSVQTSPRKSYNPFDSDDEDSNGYAKGNIDGYDIKSFETTPDSLTFHLDSSNLSWEEAILGHSQILSNSIAADASNEEVLYRKDTELFTDKVVTECELPELVFSYKDNGFHSVKDIGIDEGVPTLDKVWIETQDNYETTKLPAIQVLNDDVNSDLSFMDSLKTKSDDEVKKDLSAQDSKTEDSVKESRLAHEVLERSHSADDLLKADEFKHDSSKEEEETNCGLRSTGDSVESDGLINGTIDYQSSEKDDLNGSKVEKTGDEVSESEHCKANLPLEHTVEFPAKPLIMHEKVATRESNEVRHAEMYPAKPLKMHEVETTLNSSEAHQAETIPAKPLIKHEVEAIVESSQSTEIQNDKPSAFHSVELPVSQELPGSIVANSLPYNSKVETGSIVLDFNADTSSLDKENEEASQKPEAAIEKPPGIQSMSRDEGVSLPGYNSILDCGADKRVHGETSFSAAMPPPSSMSRDEGVSLPGYNSILDCGADKRVHGETSFSAAMPPPSSITYMGPVAYSGNISLRSESSAGSTRSFAFPVLQAEWNSSPVRMAKADQGRFRKQRGWVHSLVCCKF